MMSKKNFVGCPGSCAGRSAHDSQNRAKMENMTAIERNICHQKARRDENGSPQQMCVFCRQERAASFFSLLRCLIDSNF